MEERTLRTGVGVLLLATLLFLVILILLINDTGAWFRYYTVNMRFDSAPGIARETPVRKSGILVGRVRDVQLLPEGGVMVTARIHKDKHIFESDLCKISTGSLLGDSFIEFVQREQEPQRRLQPDAVIEDGVVPVNLVELVANLQDEIGPTLTAFSSAGESLDEAGASVHRLADRLNALLEGREGRLDEILENASQAVVSFRDTMVAVERLVVRVDTILGDEAFQDQFRSTVESVRLALVELPELLRDARMTLGTFREVALSADENLEYLKGFTQPLGENGVQLVSYLDAILDRLESTLQEYQALGRALNQGDGTIGQLLRNPDLYQNLSRAAGNIELVTEQLRPILHDIRVFADKVSRDPSRLGVRGALQGRSPIK